MSFFKLNSFFLATISIVSVNSYAQNFSETEINIGGYVKADMLLSHYSTGAPDTNSISRQSYIPGAIKGDLDNGKNVIDFHGRESRFNIEAINQIDGVSVRGFMELDFMSHFDGNERIDNGYSPRIRLAYLSYGNWSFGQNWSTFQNPSVLPENLDFSSAADGSPFIRQGQIRYSKGGFQFAIENPESTFTSEIDGTRITTGTGMIPDVVIRYDILNGSHNTLSVSSVFRNLAVDSRINGQKLQENAYSYGASVAGRFRLGDRDDIRFTITAGDGLGRYSALNFANGAVLSADGDIDKIKSVSGFIAYRHFWTTRLRSSITFSGISVDNPNPVNSLSVNKSAYSSYVNLLYSPIPSTTFGVELMHAVNKQENDEKQELTRMMLSAKYSF